MDHGLLSTQNLAKPIVMMYESFRGISRFTRIRNLGNKDFDFVNPVLRSECKEIIIIIIIIITEIDFSLRGYQKYFFMKLFHYSLKIH